MEGLTDNYEERLRLKNYSGEIVGKWLNNAYKDGAYDLINELEVAFTGKNQNPEACAILREYKKVWEAKALQDILTKQDK